MLNSEKAFYFSLLTVLCACSTTKVDSLASANSWINEGSIVIAGPVPEVSTANTNSMLAFMPSTVLNNKNYISIDRASSELRLMNGAISLKSFKISGNLPKGDYEVLLKQNNALWYASDEYFTNRGLKVPPAGDKARYLRGALGSSVIYIDEDIAIHDAPASEVGGIILSHEDMQEIYKQLEVGTQVVVK